MDQRDVDLAVRLARWIGFIENHAGADLAGLDVFDTFSPPDPVVVTRYSRRQQRREAWHPLTRPEHAAEVMAEAARRGWEVETRMSPRSSWARVASFAGARSIKLPETGIAAWCRVVCLAVLAAAEGSAT